MRDVRIKYGGFINESGDLESIATKPDGTVSLRVKVLGVPAYIDLAPDAAVRLHKGLGAELERRGTGR